MGFGYRPEIDGLRTIAVSVIVLFHLGILELSGGYLGVDIFFVISGFLITSLIWPRIRAGEFSFGDFYLRRVRRLGPSLLATLTGTLLAGAFILDGEQLEALAQSSIAAVLAVANILFWTQAGYFDAEAIEKPLLHTWSLGVEEQFYLIWPGILVLVAGWSRRSAVAGLVGLGLFSLVASEIILATAPSAAFFLMPFRVFELVTGAIIGIAAFRLRGRLASEAASLLGLVLVLGAVLTFDESTPIPGFVALVPCLGTAMLLVSRGDSLVCRLLSLSPIRYVGRISYSLYLVHWPIVVYYAHLRAPPSAPGEVVGLAALSLVLAALLYHLVEQPFRARGQYGFRIGNRGLALMGVAGLATILASSISIMATDIPSRGRSGAELAAALPELRKIRREGIRRDTCHASDERLAEAFESPCLPASIERAVVVIGDSHAADIWAALSLRNPERNVVQMTGAGCSPGGQEKDDVNHCSRFHDRVLGWVAEHAGTIDLVIVSQRGANLMSGDPVRLQSLEPDPERIAEFARFAEQVAALGFPVAVIGPRPEFRPPIYKVLKRLDALSEVQAAYSDLHTGPFHIVDDLLRQQLKGSPIRYVSSMDGLCNPDCTAITADGQLRIIDYGHWNLETAVDSLDLIIGRDPVLLDLLDSE